MAHYLCQRRKKHLVTSWEMHQLTCKCKNILCFTHKSMCPTSVERCGAYRHVGVGHIDFSAHEQSLTIHLRIVFLLLFEQVLRKFM